MSDSPKGIEYVEGLLGWIHERPQMYARFVGELDSVLHYLHLAWAKVKDRENDLYAALVANESVAAFLFSDAECVRPVQVGDYGTDRVLAFWANVDAALGIKKIQA